MPAAYGPVASFRLDLPRVAIGTPTRTCSQDLAPTAHPRAQDSESSKRDATQKTGSCDAEECISKSQNRRLSTKGKAKQTGQPWLRGRAPFFFSLEVLASSCSDARTLSGVLNHGLGMPRLARLRLTSTSLRTERLAVSSEGGRL